MTVAGSAGQAMTREVALGGGPSIVSSSVCFGHLGAMPLAGERMGSGTLSGVCSQHSTVVLTGPETWGTSRFAERANSQTPD